MFYVIPEVLRLLKMKCSLCKGPRCFLIKILWHDFGFCEHTSNDFFYRPCNFHFNILSSFEIIAKTLSVALEVSLGI